MKCIQVSGYHAYDDDGNLIATVHVDSAGNVIMDNGEDSLAIASDLDEAEIVHTLLGKILDELKGVSKPTNILTLNIVTEEET